MVEERDNYWKRKQLSRRQVLKGGLALGAGAVGLTIAGCAGTTSAPSTPTPVASAVPGKVIPKGKVTLAVSSLSTESLIPLKGVGAVETTHLNMIYDPLVRRDLQGKLVPGLATSWTVRENGKVWDFDLRKGVKFHNGDTMTAKDVKFSWDQLPKSTQSADLVIAGLTDSCEIVDDYKITVKLKKAAAPLLTTVEIGCFVMPKDYFEKVGGADEFAKKPVGTGSWRVVDRKINDFMEFEAFEESWRQVPNVKTAILRIVPDFSTRLRWLQAKEVDIVAGIIPTSMKEVESTPGLRLVVTKDTAKVWTWFLGANKLVDGKYMLNKDSPWGDKKVRQAANYAVNREQIAQKLYMGQASPMVTVGAMPSYFGFDPTLKPYPYDVAKAKALLAEAGYANGFTSDLFTTEQTAFPYTVELAEAVGGYLSAIGIKCNVTKMEYGTYLIKYKTREMGVNGLGIISTSAQYDAWRPLSIYSGTGPASMTADPEMDKMVSDVENEGDERKREELLKKAVRKEYEDAHHLFLLYGNTIYGVGDRVLDWPQQVGFGYPKWLESLKLKG